MVPLQSEGLALNSEYAEHHAPLLGHDLETLDEMVFVIYRWQNQLVHKVSV